MLFTVIALGNRTFHSPGLQLQHCAALDLLSPFRVVFHRASQLPIEARSRSCAMQKTHRV